MTNSCSEIIPRDLQGFRDYVQNSNSTVAIFGADVAGQVMLEIFKRSAIYVTAFFDNNTNKCNKELDGVQVLHAGELIHESRDMIVVIASTYIMDVVDQLESFGFVNWFPISAILREISLDQLGAGFSKDFNRFVVDNVITSQEKYLDDSLLYIRSIDLIITEKCSLKCKDCSNLMQYYEDPVNIGLDELVADVEDLCAVADEINEIRVIGGEPFVNKDFHKVIEKVSSFNKVNKIVIYTNGTIAPSEDKIKVLENKNVFISITSYDHLSRNISKLVELLDKYGIAHNVQKAYGWTDCASIDHHRRPKAQLQQLFNTCCAKNFATLTAGKVYRCPFSANVDRLRGVPDLPSDYVDLRGAARQADKVPGLKQRLRHFLREIPYIEACDYCNGRTYGDAEIVPGIQAGQPLQYVKYARNVLN